MKLPGYSAEASLICSKISYAAGSVDRGGSSRGAIVPAVDCSSVNCDQALGFCIASLDLDPISCGLYYGCCRGAGQTGGDLSGPQPDIPPSSSLPLTAGGVTVGPPAFLGERSSDADNLQRQLNRIERCACGYKGVVQAPPSWFGQSYTIS
jgi:hypothetical protein